MAQIVILESGLHAHRLTQAEQDDIWKEVNKDTNPVGKHSLFTPNDNLEYFIVSEIEIDFEKYEAVIKANKKTFKIKYTILNQDKKILKAVRNAYAK